jgi:hypothetical protein
MLLDNRCHVIRKLLFPLISIDYLLNKITENFTISSCMMLLFLNIRKMNYLAYPKHDMFENRGSIS